MNRTISVIIPVYKVEPYLERCVRSVLAQTYRELEILLVDDGSPDRCGEICDTLAAEDPRIRVIHKENGGLSSARNAALAVCTGGYIAFVDSDDFIHPEFAARMLAILEQTQAQIVQCRFEIGSADDFSEPEKESGVQIIGRYDALESMAYKVTACGKLYRREIVEGVRFPEGKINEDDATYYRFADSAQTIALTDAALYYYYQSPNSIMRSKASFLREDFIPIYETRIAYFAQKDDLRAVEGSRIRFCLVLMLFYMECKKDPNNENDQSALYARFCEEYGKIRKSAYLSKKIGVLFALFYRLPSVCALAVKALKLR